MVAYVLMNERDLFSLLFFLTSSVSTRNTVVRTVKWLLNSGASLGTYRSIVVGYTSNL